MVGNCEPLAHHHHSPTPRCKSLKPLFVLAKWSQGQISGKKTHKSEFYGFVLNVMSSFLMWLFMTHLCKSPRYLLSLNSSNSPTIDIKVNSSTWWMTRWQQWILSFGDPMYQKSSWRWIQATCSVDGAAVQVLQVPRACEL